MLGFISPQVRPVLPFAAITHVEISAAGVLSVGRPLTASISATVTLVGLLGVGWLLHQSDACAVSVSTSAVVDAGKLLSADISVSVSTFSVLGHPWENVTGVSISHSSVTGRDSSSQHPASSIDIDNTDTPFTSSTMQLALEEMDSAATKAISYFAVASHGHAATAITFDPSTSSLTQTNMQAALKEMSDNFDARTLLDILSATAMGSIPVFSGSSWTKIATTSDRAGSYGLALEKVIDLLPWAYVTLGAPTGHWRDGVVKPAGFDFLTSGNVDGYAAYAPNSLIMYSDFFRANHSTVGSNYFLYREVSPASLTAIKFFTISIQTSNVGCVGLRLDDGTDNYWIEAIIYADSVDHKYKFIIRDRNGAAITTTSYIELDQQKLIIRLSFNTNGSNYGYVQNPVSTEMYLGSGRSYASWSTSGNWRLGIVGVNTSLLADGLNVNTRYSPYIDVYKDGFPASP